VCKAISVDDRLCLGVCIARSERTQTSEVLANRPVKSDIVVTEKSITAKPQIMEKRDELARLIDSVADLEDVPRASRNVRKIDTKQVEIRLNVIDPVLVHGEVNACDSIEIRVRMA
jgi:hypothetical protein